MNIIYRVPGRSAGSIELATRDRDCRIFRWAGAFRAERYERLAESDRIAARPLGAGTTLFSYCSFAPWRRIVIATAAMSTATQTTDTTMSSCARSLESGVIGFVAEEIIS